MSESQGGDGRGLATSGGQNPTEATSDGRSGESSSGAVDERSAQLLQGGAASRSWADTTARETTRSGQAYAAPNAYSGAAGAAPGAAAGGAHGAAPAGRGPAGPQGGTQQSAPGVTRSGPSRRARLRVSHVSPASILKLSLLFGLCMLVVLLVAVAALWFVLDAAGVFSSITDATTTITDSSSSSAGQWFSFGRVMLIAVVLGLVNVVAFTLLSTVGALLYNLCADFVGGAEVTLSER